MNQPEETTLVRRAQAGDQEAFMTLIERYRRLVYRLLLASTNNAHAAEDLAQDVILKAWTNLKSFQPGTCFRAWLTRIARNTFLNSQRKKCAGVGRDGVMRTLATREPGPVAVLLARETLSLVEAAEAKLPATTRAAFCLRMQEDLPFKEVGQALSLTAATARWHVFQARRLLQQRLRRLVSPGA
jgi:RNA polymerase sigma-70 factor, ECF subfamily